MPIPSTKTRLAEESFLRVRGAASGIERAAVELLGLLNSGQPVPVSRALYYLNAIQGNRQVLKTAMAAPGVAQIATAKLADVQGVSMDDLPVTEAAIADLNQLVKAHTVADAEGYIQTVKLNPATGLTEEKTLTTPAIKALRTKLDALIATIG